MKTLILIVVTSLLVIVRARTLLEELKYGDIVAVSRTKICGCIPYKYKHYGIFLDQNRFPGQKNDENIFQFTGPLKTRTLSDCIFDKIKPEETFERDNYLDDIPFFRNKISENNITSRINETYKNCTWWWPLENNCEHLATYVRYGYKLSFQFGQQAENKVKNPEVNKDTQEILTIQLKFQKVLKELEEEFKVFKNCDEDCKGVENTG